MLKFIFVFLLLYPGSLYAEDIEIEGLSFFCAGCLKLENGICHFYDDRGKPALKACSELLLPLLEHSVAEGVGPRPLQMLSFLQANVSEEKVKLVLELLLSSDEGQDLFLDNFGGLSHRHPTAVLFALEKIPTNRWFKDLWSKKKNVWENIHLPLKTLIACRAGEVEFSTVVASSLGSEAIEVVALLEETRQALGGACSSWVAELDLVSRFLTRCIEAPERGNCDMRMVPRVSSGLRLEVQKAQTKILLEYVVEHSAQIAIREQLDLLALSSYRLHSTPEFHAKVLSLVEEGVGREEYYGASKKTRSMLNFFAKKDSLIKERLESKLGRARVVSRSAGLILVVSLILALVFIGKNGFKANCFCSPERLEAVYLQKYFGVSGDISSTELQALFRKRARSLHPDNFETGCARKFDNLCKRHTRAQELIVRGEI